MANLPENTTYGSTKTQSPVAGLSNLVKQLQQKSQTASSETMNSGTISNFNPTAASGMFTSAPITKTDTSGVIFPVNQPVGEQMTGAKTEPAPEYIKYIPSSGNDPWANPSEQTQLRNWPTDLGGGQMYSDPTQPSALIKSGRVLMDETLTPGVKKSVLGGLSPKLYQADHVIPLWMGGADTLANIEILDNITHAKKTAVQSVPLTLLANGKIDLNQAKVMALTWKDKESEGLPTPDNKGYVPIDIAEQYAKKWQQGPSMWKYFPEAFKETMGKLGNVPVLGEFAKGLVGGATAGIVPDTDPNSDAGIVGTTSNIAGNVLGTVTGLGLLSTGLGLLSKGLGWGLRGAKSLLGIQKAVALSDDALKTAGLATDIGSLTAKTLSSKARVETLKKMASNAGLLSVWGQIGLAGKEATGQEDVEFKNHVTQFLSDVAFGSLLGSSKQNIRGYAKVGLGATTLSLIEGSDIQTALQDGAIMSALHGLGYKKGLIDPKVNAGNEEAYKASATTFNQYLGDLMPTVKKGQKVPEVLKLDIPKVDAARIEYQTKYPNDQRFKNMGPITNEAEAIDFMEKASRRELGNLIAKSNGTIPQEDIKKEMSRIVVSKNQLYNQTLPPEARSRKEIADLLSMGEKLRPQIKSEQLRPAINETKLLENIPFNVPKQTMENPNNIKFPTGNVPTTGYGENIDVRSKETINNLYKNPKNFSDKLFVVKDPETASIMRLIEQEQMAAGQKPTVGNPDHALRVFAKVQTPEGVEIRPVGYMPREDSFNKKNGLNKTYHEITNRLRTTIDRSPNAEALKKALEKDRSRISITTEDAKKLFENKKAIKGMSDEDLYAILKPSDAFEKYSSGLNNSTIAETMDKNGLKVLIVDANKVLPTGGQAPRANPNNPYLELNLNEQDWLRSIAMKDGVTKGSTPVQDSINDIVSKQNAQNVSKTAGDILNKVTPTAETPIIAPTSPVEAPKAPIAAEVPTPVKTYPRLTSTLPEIKKIETPTTKIQDATDEFYNDIVGRIDDSKANISSPQMHESSLMDIVNSFKRNNPGLPEKDFKTALSMAKGRAEAYVRDVIDSAYSGTEIFGTDDPYSRIKTSENKNVLVRRFNELKRRGSEVPLKTFEKTEMTDLKSKINKHVELDKEAAKISDKAAAEGRELTPNEKVKLEDINKERFTLTQDYLGEKDTSLVLANKFGLELKPANDAGIRFLKLDKSRNPIFTEEFKKANKITTQTPQEFWGTFLKGEMDIYKNDLTRSVKEWGRGIEEMKKAKDPYAKGFAGALDASLKEKYDVKDPKTGETKYSWKESWKLNPIFKNTKDLFAMTNEEGMDLSQPFRRTAAITAGKDYKDIAKSVAKADIKTRAATEQAKEDRFLREISGKKKELTLPEGMRTKDPNQLENVSEDLTPLDIMMNGLLNSDARNKLVGRYNNIRKELESSTSKFKPELMDQMKLLFSQIKKLSVDIPDEVKTWKLGSRIDLKNKGEPTLEQGIKDGFRVANSLFKKKAAPGYVKFENVRDAVLKQNKKDGAGGPYDGRGGGVTGSWGDTTPQARWGGFSKPFSSVINYNFKGDQSPVPVPTAPVAAPAPIIERPVTTSPKITEVKKPTFNAPVTNIPNIQSKASSQYDVRGMKISDDDLKEAANILYGEISNRPGKQEMETRHIINTAINRALTNPKGFGATLTEVLQKPMQYQAYAPAGTTTSDGIVESQYQKVKKGKDIDTKKLQLIMNTLNELKSGKFKDTTGGSVFYVHAGDGSLWLGKTQAEAKKAANDHEKKIKKAVTTWGTAIGAPASTTRQ